ncbi:MULTISPECIES: ABC transporter ATP-binding protein [unclassified Mycolicibacterium]|uniref:ABC transporter ATP-binding protein n=1 Tax=unclassified Mycolicibacterium TaxID=2636767 RepID=UPI00130B618E|nr:MULTISPECIES: ABC transporter ATP-binding protein [unclassified Mycolicibacterium]MUL81153.1 ABC transporter ATP-binding protein [Mycolicibacterium sp. CBMA 329]MUL86919.1 ABC transporter ATP-binding protein [Mycolicibacterium sp. CBMA 331]MUL98797.1 ABC transporter ATP-binding protein [Mycolicibacterium sp. CBMA 334]MUM25656.1 ABC transporter ATP-binding protein [Mycolicibacterium sp. CBMA 295]MUM37216.1 ABC transporter ATP-binding protein [Mycolicibacterium sp. CBMA 247]
MSTENKPHGASITLRGLTKTYGSVTAVDAIDLEARPGEFLTFLGPSGSGKTTTLNMIAGFVDVTEGELLIDGRPVADLPPYRRNIGMVFQHYALFPHMTVVDNVAYPLRQRKVAKEQCREKVTAALAKVGLDGYGKRMPKELSGGQQQRVALARAMVYEPSVLLMDEPLGALDKKLRDSLQLEIKRIHGELGTTFVYVTHDQDEALVLSDRIAVFNNARIEQIGSPTDLYEYPKSVFVARFLGESSLFYGKHEDGGVVYAYGRRLVAGRGESSPGASVAVVVRPERLRIVTGEEEPDVVNAVPGTVIQEIYLGNSRKVEVRLPDDTIALVRESAGSITPTQAGQRVWLTFDPDVAAILPADE